MLCYYEKAYIEALDLRPYVSCPYIVYPCLPFVYLYLSIVLLVQEHTLYVFSILDTPISEAIWVYSRYTHNA